MDTQPAGYEVQVRTTDAAWAARHGRPAVNGRTAVTVPSIERFTHCGADMVRFDMEAVAPRMPADWWNRWTACPAVWVTPLGGASWTPADILPGSVLAATTTQQSSNGGEPVMKRDYRAVYNLADGTSGALVGAKAEVDGMVADLRRNGHTGTVRVTRLNPARSAEHSPKTITL